MNNNSVFGSLREGSSFFERGSVGYSLDTNGFDGLKLDIYKWEVKPLEVVRIRSGFFENNEIFPEGSVRFDNALLMEQVGHDWRSVPSVSC